MIPQRLFSLGLLLMGISLTSCSTPTRANNPAQPTLSDQELKTKVLAIIKENPAVVLDSIQAYQQEQQQRQQTARRAFLERIQANPRSIIGESPIKGSKEPKLLLIKFSDFQCPYCAVAHQTLKDYFDKNPNQITLVYKHLPLASHPEAMPAAKAAWAAGQQGKFWEYQDALFTNQEQLGEALYGKIATSLGLDLEKFNRDRQSGAAEAAIRQDQELADTLGINSTPFMILNGQVIPPNVKVAELEAVVSQLAQAGGAGSGQPPAPQPPQ